jgi:hypothetical protein
MNSAAALILYSGITSNMLASLLSVLGINKLWIYLAVGMTALIATTGAYYLWKSSVEQRAFMEFNMRQLEQSIKDQEEYRRRQEALEEQQREAARALADQNRVLNSRVQTIQRMLNSPETAAGDRPSSDVLRQTIDQLREIR